MSDTEQSNDAEQSAGAFVLAPAPIPPETTEHPTVELRWIGGILHQAHIVMDAAGATIERAWRKVGSDE